MFKEMLDELFSVAILLALILCWVALVCGGK